MKRYLADKIREDCQRKMVLLSGPRQVGKTTLARALPFNPLTYLNFDSGEDREIISSKTWLRQSKLLILDELHKKKNWKRWLKGVFDTEYYPPYIIVTGSARLDVYRKGGDSLAGRYYPYRLHPLSIGELAHHESPEDALKKLLVLGGFPEPYLSGSETEAARWRRTHVDRILREDVLDLEQVRNLKSLEQLVDLLSRQVGSPIAHESLARDLEVSPHTIKHWISILEAMYVLFLVTPYSANVRRAIRKQPKVYFFDTAYVRGDSAARFENLVATALLKYNHFREDVFGERRSLHYVRDREKREVDFCMVNDDKVERLIEAKWQASDTRQLLYFQKMLSPKEPATLLVRELKRELSVDGAQVSLASKWLAKLI